MNIELLTVGPFEVNCAVLWNTRNEALIIDPGCDAEEISQLLQRHKLTPAGYLLTHGHVDHISALAALHAQHPAPVYIHTEDLKWAFGEKNEILPYYTVPAKPDAEWVHPESSDAWTVAGLNFKCIETPGHTRGGVCYLFENEKVIFTGDTLFKGTCGRTDLPGGDARILSSSLKKLAALPEDITVYAGHGNSTTIGEEKRSNFFMQQAR